MPTTDQEPEEGGNDIIAMSKESQHSHTRCAGALPTTAVDGGRLPWREHNTRPLSGTSLPTSPHQEGSGKARYPSVM